MTDLIKGKGIRRSLEENRNKTEQRMAINYFLTDGDLKIILFRKCFFYQKNERMHTHPKFVCLADNYQNTESSL